jgi:nicotinate dehydrogenase subunit A
MQLSVNGKSVDVEVDSSTTLLEVLRNDLGLSGPRFGCGLGQCGACTVLLNGTPIRSCVTPVSAIQGNEVTTIEGLGTLDSLHKVQAAFIDEQAAQCGYCANGMVMSASALLERNPSPTDQEIRKALDSYLCRCGTHTRIIKAVKKASGVV